MFTKKILSLTLSCMLAVGALGVAGVSEASPVQAYVGTSIDTGSDAPTYSKATTGAIIGGVVGAIAGHNTKKGHTQHMITDGIIGAVVGGVIANNT